MVTVQVCATSKYGVVGTLHHRAQLICSSPELLQQEEKHLHQALTRCNYPRMGTEQGQIKIKGQEDKNTQQKHQCQ